MSHYDNVILPEKIASGASMGPSTSTDQIWLASGFRKANRRWSQKLRKMNVGWVIQDPDLTWVLVKLWEAVEGPANSFLAQMPYDWNTTDGIMKLSGSPAAPVTAIDQPLRNTVTGGITGDGTTATFQCVRDYVTGSASHRRTIRKPKSAILVAVNGVLKTAGVDYNVDYAMGIVTFIGGHIPPNGQTVTWGGEYYTPVHFVADDLMALISEGDATSVPDVELIEARLA